MHKTSKKDIKRIPAPLLSILDADARFDVFANALIKELRSPRETPDWGRVRILMEGLRAWVICPTTIYRQATRDCPPATSQQFRHSSMLVSATSQLGLYLQIARNAQNNGKDGNASDMLGHPALKRFDWDLFFALGGLRQAIDSSAWNVWRLQLQNQLLPIQAAAMVVHCVRQGRKGNHRSGRQRLGANTYYKLAATQLTPIFPRASSGSKEGISDQGISNTSVRDYWKALRPLAALLYAATLVDSGRLYLWLVSEFDPYFYDDSGPEQYAEEWFGLANIVAEEVLRPIDMLDTAWKPLSVAHVSSLPNLENTNRFRGILSQDRIMSVEDFG